VTDVIGELASSCGVVISGAARLPPVLDVSVMPAGSPAGTGLRRDRVLMLDGRLVACRGKPADLQDGHPGQYLAESHHD
jgi:hypothetical protein